MGARGGGVHGEAVAPLAFYFIISLLLFLYTTTI